MKQKKEKEKKLNNKLKDYKDRLEKFISNLPYSKKTYVKLLFYMPWEIFYNLWLWVNRRLMDVDSRVRSELCGVFGHTSKNDEFYRNGKKAERPKDWVLTKTCQFCNTVEIFCSKCKNKMDHTQFAEEDENGFLNVIHETSNCKECGESMRVSERKEDWKNQEIRKKE